jgi:hypothetical protein
MAAALVAALFGGLLLWHNPAGSQPAPARADTAQRGDDAVQRAFDALRRDTTGRQPDSSVVYDDGTTMVVREKKPAKGAQKNFLDDVITGKNKDSLIYDLKTRQVYIYKEGDVQYQSMELKADFMRIDMKSKEIFAHGVTDTLGVKSRPEFSDAASSYTMDTIHYNLDSKKAKINNVATQEGEGYLIGNTIKKMPDNSMNIAGGKYTTCDHLDDPHFYIAMPKAKMIPGKKVIVGPSYLVFEGVPVYFLGVPFGFFPVNPTARSGFIMPTYGEERNKGFFIRDGGYYWAISDYFDLKVTGGVFTFGSWNASMATNYVKRYSFNGSFGLNYSKDIIGIPEDGPNYINQNNLSINWRHTQDPRFRPNSTFSASVDYRTSGYSKYASQNLNQYLTNQTNSSIAYSKTWAGTPFSFSTNLQLSQNSRDTTMTFSLPNVVFNVSKFFPFARKEQVGKQRWWEKVSMSYTGNLTNNVTVKERDMFKEKMFKDMRNGVTHSVPISTSTTVLKYIQLSLGGNYSENWYFSSVEQHWDPAKQQVVRGDTTYGFYRDYKYSASFSGSTKVYGLFQFGPKSKIQAIRHVLTPSAGMSFTPNFNTPFFGLYKPVQTDSNGKVGYYSPLTGSTVGGSTAAASLNFSLGNTLEMKVLSKSDTSGVKKIKLLEALSASSSWNFLADSLNLSPFSLSLRTGNLIGNFAINLSATLDPYQLDDKGRRINRFMFSKGSPGRITSTGWSFSYTFNSKKSSQPAVNDISSTGAIRPEDADFFARGDNRIDPETRRRLMTAQYYDFSIPWNLGFNYSLSYSNPSGKATVTQSLGFNGSINLTPKWGITFSSGYDFVSRRLTPGQFSLARDLHCWQMTFQIVPFGFMKSWSFNIAVKSSLLKDLKYDQKSSPYDNLDR